MEYINDNLCYDHVGNSKKTQKKEKLGQTKEVSIGTRVQIRSSRPPLDTLC